ncbi:hypothetical protein B566_EDAN007645 [Ephemera danica]|nr:hypothetical protein B566_EDAN007645 [Ephemera danica]
MFSQSTQKKFWLFSDESELLKARNDANKNFILKHGAHLLENDRKDFFLSTNEEKLLLRQYELQLREFCRRFEPPMPRSVIGTAFHYFKRFYLLNSVMDYHPKEILVTCVYLACKVDEFNVSISQFVKNIKGDRNKAADIILNNELLLMQVLNYNLTTRGTFNQPERLRDGVDEFLEKAFLTSAPLLVAPSQLALAAVLHAASKVGENLDAYVTQTLLGDAGPERLANLTRSMVKSVEAPPRDTIRQIEKKLEKCRNQDNNPDSEAYKKRQLESLEDEEERAARIYEAQRRRSDDDVDLTGLPKTP